MKCRSILKGMLSGLLACSLWGCSNTPDPVEEEPVDLIIKVPTLTIYSIVRPDLADSTLLMNYAIEKYKEANPDTNINFYVETFDYVDEGKAIVGCYDTPDAPDVLFEDHFNMSGYMNHNRLAPLDDIISDEIRADISEASWKMSQKDGKTLMMHYLSRQNILSFSKQMFLDAGLDQYVFDEPKIQSWNIDEWNNILEALTASLPEDSNALQMYAVNNQGDTHILAMLHAFGGDYFTEDGSFDFTQPEVIKALEWIQSGVDKGWYAPHPENLELLDNQQLFANNRLAITTFNNGYFSLYEDPLNDFGFVNFLNGVATSFITGFEVFDNGDEAKLNAAKDFVKFFYENEELMDISAGNIPESRRVTEKYADQLLMLEEFSANADHVIDFMHGANNWQGRDDSFRSVFYKEYCSVNLKVEYCVTI